jgi:hypothetical protein
VSGIALLLTKKRGVAGTAIWKHLVESINSRSNIQNNEELAFRVLEVARSALSEDPLHFQPSKWKYDGEGVEHPAPQPLLSNS